ncbi:UDP-glycosyltransferase 74B1-like [Cornus florida]|uniref:UDP-glycosyltransferase 74B1-like n=1 Tax=Cornus florida TaxID=4283 RepID=UPI00289E98F8|nr:UDP-glycosyltransferase 74B1-like [Cornus florida]
MEKQRGHVIVLTYPAQGHINPLLQFAKRLASKGLKATLATTHYTVNSIRAGGVGVEPISDGYDDGGFKHAPSVEAYLESFKMVGSRTLNELILKFKHSASPVNCLVYDSLLPWALDVAKQLGIYGAVFLTNSASVCSMYWQIEHGLLTLPVRPEMVPLSLPGLPPLGVSDMPSFIAQPATHSAYLAVIMEKFSILEQNDWVFVNTFEDLESELAKVMSGLWPLVMVGPMVPSAFLDQQIEGDTDYGANFWEPVGDRCLRWLETKPPKSVIYVAFGSMAEIAAKQVEEIAWGLKGSNKHFLWVMKESENEKLPVEFLNSIDETGLVVTWCNQLEVLAHQAVGCFMTHCGWNSTLEGLSLGVPMLAMSRWSDQPMNAKFLEDVWRVGVRAKKDEEGILRREELEMCIKEIMVGEKSDEIRKNASMWRESAKSAVSRGGSSDKNIDKFVEVLLVGRSK